MAALTGTKPDGDNPNMNLNLSKPLAVVGVVLGAIISILVLAALLPQFFDATAQITGEFTNATTGNTAADAILSVFAFVVPIALVAGIVGLVLLAVKFGKK